jgi:hypothetical protein
VHTERTARHTTLGTSSETSEVVRVWLLDIFRVSVGSKTIEDKGWSLRKAAGLVKLLSYLMDKSLVAAGSRSFRRKQIAGCPSYRPEERGNELRGG